MVLLSKLISYKTIAITIGIIGSLGFLGYGFSVYVEKEKRITSLENVNKILQEENTVLNNEIDTLNKRNKFMIESIKKITLKYNDTQIELHKRTKTLEKLFDESRIELIVNQPINTQKTLNDNAKKLWNEYKRSTTIKVEE